MKTTGAHRLRHSVFPLSRALLSVGVAIVLFAIVWTQRWPIRTARTMLGIKNPPVCGNCNVIVVSLDTLSAPHLPCYGYDKNTMPNLCAFARDNIWFPASYAQSFFTLPSQTSILTSLYPSTHGMLEQRRNTLDPTRETLAQALKRQGYNTLYFGPTDSDEMPLDRGFGRGFDYLDTGYSYDKEDGIRPWYKAIRMLAANEKIGKPTFMFLHTYYPHAPYLPGTRDLRFTKDAVADIPVDSDEYLNFSPDFIRYAQNYFRQNPMTWPLTPELKALYTRFLKTEDTGAAKLIYDTLTTKDCSDFCLMLYYDYEQNKNDPRKVAYMRALYDELLLQLDSELNTFLKTLTPYLKKNTILVLTADHGEAFMEHGDLFHTTLYDEVIRVPLIFSVPNLPPRTDRVMAEGIDIFPTILGILGLSPQTPLEGADLTSSLLGTPFATGKPYIFSERYQMIPGVRKEIPIEQKTVIDGRWKLYVRDMEDADNPKNLELYDVVRDPSDRTNLAAKYPAVVRRLLRTVRDFAKTHTATFPDPAPEKPAKVKQTQRFFRY